MNLELHTDRRELAVVGCELNGTGRVFFLSGSRAASYRVFMYEFAQASICPGTALTLPKYFCRNCENPLALGEDLISKKFVGASGPAFMFSYAMNVVVGPKIGRKLLTGSYVVADVMCSKCGEKLGWKYVETYCKQRYKEGMFVIAKLKLTKKY
ncbi:PREDICTED: protein yippee-like At4g27740 [Brassica oleracea var. oleracea]|uniref:protein yippee-like At4g27740 n=1 Tax=Brassica oleracea var. oleracea TaxID=109376 RepID=UPI0006A6F421|nr:PREDICTED: protein yippee-like At4g27740 [Brassica oleracea var. oleracea]